MRSRRRGAGKYDGQGRAARPNRLLEGVPLWISFGPADRIKGNWALVRASRDQEEGVRNTAVVWATLSSKTASEIPADNFVEMLDSGVWTDRNKAGKLIALATQCSPKLLNRLLTSALPSLIEMTQWSDSNHADAYRALLGRIAGLDERAFSN